MIPKNHIPDEKEQGGEYRIRHVMSGDLLDLCYQEYKYVYKVRVVYPSVMKQRNDA
jgi:hypothetical protein